MGSTTKHKSAQRSTPTKRAQTHDTFLRRHRHALAVIAACTLVFIWMVTFGTWRLFDTETFGFLYDAQMRSLLNGRWDVPWESITFEAFIRDGKNYAYFGFVPALIRLPFMILPESADGHWSRLSQVCGYVVSLALSYGLLRRARAWYASAASGGAAAATNESRRVEAVVVATLGLGSTLMFMGSRSFVYHEAMMWGSALALASYYNLMCYLAEPRGRRLAWACVYAYLTLFTRASVGAGPLLALALVAANIMARHWRWAVLAPARWLNPSAASPPPYRHVAGVAVTLACVMATYVAVNYAKFHTFLDAHPTRLYYSAHRDPSRMEGSNPGVLRPVNLRMGAYAYLSPGEVMLRPYFPWVLPVPPKFTKRFPEANFAVLEPHASITATSPVLCALALIGLFAMRRRIAPTGACATIPLAGAAAAGVIMFVADGLSERYLHDLFPLFALGGAIGTTVLLNVRRRAARRTLWWIGVPLVAWSVYVNVTMALLYQRQLIWGVPPERQEQYAHFARFMDENFSAPLFGWTPPEQAAPPAQP